MQMMRKALLIFWLLPIVGEGFSSSAFGADGDAETRDWGLLAETSQRRLQAEPNDEKAWAELVQGWLGLEDFRHAESALAAWRAKIGAPAPISDRLQGDLAFARRDFAAAIEAWKRYTHAVPTDALGWDRLAKAQEQLGDFAAAIGSLVKASESAPSASRFAWRARLKTRAHDWAGAVADAEEGNRIDATDADIGALYPIFERRKEWLPKVELLSAALEREPDNIELLLDRGEALANEGLIEAAHDDIEVAYQKRRGSLRARFWRGLLAWERDDREQVGKVMHTQRNTLPEGALARLRELETEVDPELRGAFLMEISQPVLALEEVDAVDASIAKAAALQALGRLPEAGQAARRAAEMHPGNDRAWRVLGEVEMGNGNMSEALKAFDRSLKIKQTEEVTTLRKAVLRRRDS